MKTLCLSLCVVALASVLASSPASAEEQRARTLMPLLPGKEEQLRLLVEARQNENPGMRLPSPVSGFHRRAGLRRAHDDQPRIVPNFKPPTHTGEREKQHDIAGRVAVKVDDSLRIINGQKAVLGQFPWQAGVYMDFGYEGKAWCGGSIIHSLWILTAAHCVDDHPNSYTIIVGSLGSEKGTEPSRKEIKGVTTTYQHPTYSSYFIDNDIGFVKLPSHLEFNAYVRPVQLPSYSMAVDMMIGTKGTVSGWGKRHDSDQWISSDLMYVDNVIDNGKACYEIYGNAWIPNKLCVKTEDVHSFCSGDSGGAFTFEETPGQHTQIGIVSFGHSAGCEKKYPTAYTRLASFLDFVEETTNIAIRD